MSTGTRSDFGAARPSAGRPAYPEAPATRRAPGAERIAALSALVESITEQLDAIEGASRRNPARRPAAETAPEPARAAVEPDRLGEIEARLAAIASQMAATQQPATPAAASVAAPLAASPAPVAAPAPQPQPAPSRPSSLQSAIAEISARQKAIDGDAGRLPAIDSVAIEDAITALRSDIGTLARRIGSEARRSEEMDKALRADIAARLDAGPRDDGGRFEELRRHLDEIRQSIGASARETTLASIEAGYSHVIERLDEITRRVPERARVDLLAEEIGRLGQLIDRVQPFRSMEGELEDIRNQIAAFASTHSDLHLERQIAELRHAVERLADAPRESVDLTPLQHDLAAIRREVDGFAKGTDPVLLVRLEQQVAAVHGMMERLAEGGVQGGGAALSRLEERIDALSGRFDAIIDLPALQGSAVAGGSGEAAVAAIDGLRDEIASLRSHVVEREPLRFDQIDRQMMQLMERLDAATTRDDGRTLAQLEAQVASLADKFVDAGPAPDALGRLEDDIGRLQSMIGETRVETIEAARNVARDALTEFAGRLPQLPNEQLIQSLREDLRNLQSAALNADRQNHDTLETVHDTLTRLVERIARLEADERLDEDEAASSFAAPIPSRRLGDLPEDHRPLAPGSGKPDLSLRAEPAAAEEAVAEATPRPTDRKADFIAAARRAAQAAQAETVKARKAERMIPPTAVATGDDEAMDEDEEGEARPGPLARIGNLLRRRRRSMALAIAAVILAIGAAKYGQPVAESLFASEEPASIDRTATGSIAPAGWAQPSSERTAVASPNVSLGGWARHVDRPDATADAGQTQDATTADASLASAEPGASAAAAKAGAGPDLAQPALVAPDPNAPLAFEPASALSAPLAAAADAAAAPAVTAAATPAPVALDMAAVKRDATSGDPVAAFELAKGYAEGIGVRRDVSLAAQWYAQSAKAGLAVAQYRIGSLYERGEGVKRDLVAAEKWYRKASDQGNARATHNLAVMVSEGANAAPDYASAAKLFIVAGDLGVADSQYNLGVLYARGLGVKVDLVQSYKWFALAAQQGDTDAGKRRDEVAKALSADDLASARAAVQVFQPKPQDPKANLEPTPRADWLQTAATTPPLGKVDLSSKG